MAFRCPLFALLVVGACAGSAADDWKQSLSASDREHLESSIAHLQKKSRKEQDIASQDGPDAQAFFKKEYETKIAHLVEEYKKVAEKSAVHEATRSPADSHADSGTDSSADFGAHSSDETSADSSDDPRAESSAADETTVSDPLMLVAEPNADGDEDGDEVATDPREADKDARRAARKADEEMRREARKADEEARKAARRADEEARKAARREDEMKRHEEERYGNETNVDAGAEDAGPVMLPALEQHAVTFLVSFVAGASLVAIATHASVQHRWCRNRAQVALLDDAGQV